MQHVPHMTKTCSFSTPKPYRPSPAGSLPVRDDVCALPSRGVWLGCAAFWLAAFAIPWLLW